MEVKMPYEILIQASSSNPELSVIMASYNSSLFIEKSIKSVLSQTFNNLELIIIDDCSTDLTIEIIKSTVRKVHNVTLIRLNENSGPANARNFGISNSRGEWIGILDSDDIAFEERFELQMKATQSDPNLILVASGANLVDDSQKIKASYQYPSEGSVLRENLVLMKRFPPHSSIVYKKDILLSLGGFNKRYKQAEDYDLWLRLSLHGDFYCLNKKLVSIRKHEGNISKKSNGDEILLYAIVSGVCFYYKTYLSIDPSCELDNSEWEVFLSEIKKILVSSKYYRYLKFKDALKESLHNRNLRKFLSIIILNSNDLFSYSKIHLTGSKITYEIYLKLREEKIFQDGSI